MTRTSEDKPESLRVVWTRGGYAVFVSPSVQPAAVFTSGLEVLDWLAHRIAEWETRQPLTEPPRTEAEGDAIEGHAGEDDATALG